MSSFAPGGITDAAKFWPSPIECCELYAFMHRDLKLHGQFPLPAKDHVAPSAASILARLWTGGRSERAKIATLAGSVIRTANTYGIKIRALASFLPHLLARQQDRRDEAVNALKTLCALAREIRRQGLNDGHDVTTVEFVGGSRVAGLVCAQEQPPGDDDHTLFSVRRDCTAGALALGQILNAVVNELGLGSQKSDDDFCLSVELEPGPLFTIHDLAPLKALLDSARNTRLESFLGFNLDIAHFALAGIEPGAIEGDELLSTRMNHIHISDHGLGHFSDAPIGQCGLRRHDEDVLATFRRWISLAKKLSRPRRPGLPRFSGLVSLELEAVRSESMIHQSLRTLMQLLAE